MTERRCGPHADFALVPDFRSSTGLFTTLRSEHKLKASGKQLFDASVYQTDSATSSFHDMVRNLSDLVSNAQPTPFHQMLSSLGEEGRLMRLYTQNVDGIDVALPSLETTVPLNPKGPWPRTIQLHGGLEKMVCSKCNHLSKFQPLLFDGPRPPLCKVCIDTDKIRTDHAGKRSHGIGKLRPRMVLYNEHNPDEEAIGAVVSSDLRSRPDAVIVVGTSMKIPGVRRIVREMCGVVRGRRDGLAIWINRDPPPVGKEFEDCWDLVVKGSSDTVARISDDSKSYMDCTDSDAERARAKDDLVQVVIHSPVKGTFNHGMPTPSASPRPSKQLELSIKSKTQLHVKPKFVAKKQVEITSRSSSVPPKANPKSHKSKPKGPAKIKTTKKVNTKTASTAPSSTINQLFKQTKSTSASSTNPRKPAKEPLKREPSLKPALSATTASTFNRLFSQTKSTSVSSTVTKKTSQAAFRIQLPLPRQSYPPRSNSTIFEHISSRRTPSIVPQTPIHNTTNDSHIFKYSPPAPVEPRVSLSTPFCRVPTTPDPPDWEPLTPIQFQSGGSNGSRRPELYSTPQPPSCETPTPRHSTWKHVSKRPDSYYTPPPPQFEPLTPQHRRSSGSNGLWGSESNSVSPNTVTRKFWHTVSGGSDELCMSPTTMTRRFWRTVGGPTEKCVYNGVTVSPTSVPRNMDRLLN
jgi:NAD-dependent histone deacetylase SIR2